MWTARGYWCVAKARNNHKSLADGDFLASGKLL